MRLSRKKYSTATIAKANLMKKNGISKAEIQVYLDTHPITDMQRFLRIVVKSHGGK